jgi:hypothetical protein
MDIEYQIIDYRALIFNILSPIYKSDDNDDKIDIFKSLIQGKVSAKYEKSKQVI